MMDEFSGEQLRQRHELILGKPMRVQPASPASEEEQELLGPPPGFDKKYVGRGAIVASKAPSMFAVMLHNPGLLRQWRGLTPFLMTDGTLPPQDRELAVLRGAWLRQMPFIWGEHVVIGKRVGLRPEQIEWLTQGAEVPGWSEHERAVVRAAEELLDSAMIADATWETLSRTLSEAQLVELPILVGAFQTLGYFQNSVRYPLWDGNPGLSAR